MGRDPRVEPRAGDVVRNKHGDVFRVVSSKRNRVEYEMRSRDRLEFWQSTFDASIFDWRTEHRTATVIHVAEG